MLFITGATGLIGSHLCAKIQTRAVALVRKKTPGLKLAQVVGDINTPSTYEHALKGCDTVIHLACALDERSPDLWKVNVDGTRALLDACTGQRFIHASTTGIYGPTLTPATEKTPANPTTQYEHSKLASEILVKESGLPYTILRPTLVYGPNTYWTALLKLAKKNFPLIGNGNNYFHTVYAGDVATAMLTACRKKHARKDYIIAAHTPLTLKQTYDAMKAALGVNGPTRHIPRSLALAASHLAQFIPNTVFIPAYVKRLTRNRIYDVRKAEKNGLSCKTPFDKGIAQTITDLKKTVN